MVESPYPMFESLKYCKLPTTLTMQRLAPNSKGIITKNCQHLVKNVQNRQKFGIFPKTGKKLCSLLFPWIPLKPIKISLSLKNQQKILIFCDFRLILKFSHFKAKYREIPTSTSKTAINLASGKIFWWGFLQKVRN